MSKLLRELKRQHSVVEEVARNRTKRADMPQSVEARQLLTLIASPTQPTIKMEENPSFNETTVIHLDRHVTTSTPCRPLDSDDEGVLFRS